MLVLDSFSVGYAESTAWTISAPSLQLQPGQRVVLTGLNGSGKSTLCAGIMGLDHVRTQGALTWDGRDLCDEPSYVRARAGIMYIPQHSIDIPGLHITTLLRASLRAAGKEVDEDVLNQSARDAYHMMGLSFPELDQGLHVGLSGGQKRRAELAQMMVLRPRLVIIDEIDAHVDAEGQRLIIQAIDSLYADCPDTMLIMATHNERIRHALRPDIVWHITQGIVSPQVVRT